MPPRVSQHSGKFTARPPSEVSLYFSRMSSPVWRMVSIQLSSGMKWVPSPCSASEAAETALIAPSPLRSMQGTCTKPLTGSHVMPRWCSSAISAAFSTWALVPPSAAHRPAAAIAEAEPTSAWQPSSAPEIEAFSLTMPPIAAAVSRKTSTPGVSRADAVAAIIADHSRHHAGGSVGRRGHDPPAGGVLLVDRQRVGGEPVVDRVRLRRARAPRRD